MGFEIINYHDLEDIIDEFNHLVEDHELPDVVEHVVVLGGGEGHVVDDGGHVAKDGGVEQGGGDHQEKAEQLKQSYQS